jgi:hypothetical protein
LLLKEKHPSEAAILCLTQFELRLDLAYTAYSVDAAREWIEHEKTKISVQKIRSHIDNLFSDDSERDDLDSIFRYLSGIKHGNPVFSELGFPGRRSGHSIEIFSGPVDDDFEANFTDAVFAYAVYQLSWAAQVINICTAQYAKVDPDLRKRVHYYAHSLQNVQKDVRKFFEDVAENRAGHFGMKDLRKGQ